MCAKVKRLCSAMLRFMRSLRNSRGEWRGEFRGESQGDIRGDPQGEADFDCGFSWMGWGLLIGKVPAPPDFSQRISLMLLCYGLTKPDLGCWSLEVVQVVHLKAAAFFKEIIKHLSSLSYNDALHAQRHLWESLNSSDPMLLENLHYLFWAELSASTVDGHGHECRTEPSPQQKALFT